MIGDLVSELTGWLERLPPQQPRMDALVAALRAEFGGSAAPVTAAVMAACDGARGVALDLRRNGGGDPATVAALVAGCADRV